MGQAIGDRALLPIVHTEAVVRQTLHLVARDDSCRGTFFSFCNGPHPPTHSNSCSPFRLSFSNESDVEIFDFSPAILGSHCYLTSMDSSTIIVAEANRCVDPVCLAQNSRDSHKTMQSRNICRCDNATNWGVALCVTFFFFSYIQK